MKTAKIRFSRFFCVFIEEKTRFVEVMKTTRTKYHSFAVPQGA